MAKRGNGEGTINKYKNGWRGTISLGYDDNGNMIRKQFYGKTQAQVIEKMKEYKSLETFGLIPKDEKTTLQEWVYLWLTQYKIHDCRPATLERYHGIYRNYINNSEIGVVKLKDLRASNIQFYYNKLLNNSGKTPDIIKSLHKVVKAALNQAQREQHIMMNPCNHVNLPKIQQKDEIETFTEAEQKQLIKSLEDHRLYALFVLAFGTGCRLGEILALKWEDLNWNTEELEIRRTFKRVKKLEPTNGRKTEIIEQEPKTKYSARTIPLPSNLLPVLKDHRKRQLAEKLAAGDAYDDEGLIFATPLGKAIDARNLTHSYKLALEKNNIPYKKFHALRHSYATRLFENGVPIKTIQVLMGHSRLEITANIYTHVMPKEKIAAVEVLNRCI